MWLVTGGWVVLALLLSLAAVYLTWNSRVLVPWLVLPLLQLPICFVGLVAWRIADPRPRYLSPAVKKELERIEIFISFSAKDVQVAERLKKLLDDNGHPAWLCFRNISSGRDWMAELGYALEKCRLVLFVRSKDSIASDYCLNELKVASEAGKPILPVRMDSCKLSTQYKIVLGTTQNVDVRGRDESNAYPEILDTVDRMLADGRTE